MNNKILKVFLCIIALCVVFASFSACGNGKDVSEESEGSASSGENTYVFTVIYGDTNLPASGVSVQICKGEEFCLMPVTTDDNGVANYVLTSGNEFGEYEVHIIGGIPEGYEFDNNSIKTNANDTSYTLTLTPSGSESGQDNSENVDNSENDSEDNNGDNSENGGVVDTSNTIEPECQHIYVNGECTKCGLKQLIGYTVKVVYESDFTDDSGKRHTAGDPISNISLAVTDESGSKIAAMGATDSNGEFAFEAPEYLFKDQSGTVIGGYAIHITGQIPDGLGKESVYYFQKNSRTITLSLYSKVTVSGEKSPFSPAFISAGVAIHETLNEARKDDAEGKTEIQKMTCSPCDESYYYYAFRPTSLNDEGLYKFTVSDISGATSVYIGRFIGNAGYVQGSPEESASGANPSIQFSIPKSDITDVNGRFVNDNYWLIGIKADSKASYPVSFTIKLEKVRDLVPGKDYPKVEKHILTLAEGTKSADEITGPVKGTLTNAASNATLVKDSDGYYHIGSASGPYAMVTLASPNKMLWNDPFVFFCNVNEMAGVEQLGFTETVTVNGITTNHIYYYHDLLVAYGELCNSDGAYVINDELLVFLKKYAAEKLLETSANAYLQGVTYYK